MVKNKKKDNLQDDFTAELINQINKTHNEKIAFNLGTDNAPTNVKRWISTGSKQLDFLVSNQLNGGLPEGRIVEIQGPVSCGKSHISFEIAKSAQKMGGIIIYIDTENATSLQNLMQLGVDVKKKFVFVQTSCTEDIFQVCEETIIKARAMTRDVPVVIIWDSIAASSPKAELEGAYDKDTIGLQARVLGKGLRKITNIIGNQNVLMVLINQQRMKIGVMFGDPTTTPGGNAIPYSSSVRIRINSTGQQQIKDKEGNVIGIKVKAKTIKNKVARPFRECEFQIIFGVGIVEHEEVFDLFRSHCSSLPKNQLGVACGNEYVMVEGTAAWKTFTIVDGKNGEIVSEKKFHKSDFKNILYDPKYEKYMNALYIDALLMHSDAMDHPTYKGISNASVEEIKASTK